MFRYPAVYCVLVLPMSIVRWLTFIHDFNSAPSVATFIVVSIFGLSGFVDVILLLTTRPLAGLFGELMFRDETPTKPPSSIELSEQPPAFAIPPTEPEPQPMGGDGQIIEQPRMPFRQ